MSITVLEGSEKSRLKLLLDILAGSMIRAIRGG